MWKKFKRNNFLVYVLSLPLVEATIPWKIFGNQKHNYNFFIYKKKYEGGPETIMVSSWLSTWGKSSFGQVGSANHPNPKLRKNSMEELSLALWKSEMLLKAILQLFDKLPLWELARVAASHMLVYALLRASFDRLISHMLAFVCMLAQKLSTSIDMFIRKAIDTFYRCAAWLGKWP